MAANSEQLDEEDLALRAALAGMQDVVERHLAQTGKDAQTLTSEELYWFAAKVAPYLEFELDHSDDIWRPMPLEAKGDGAFLLAEDGEVVGIQQLAAHERVVDMVKRVLPYSVPTTRWLHENLSSQGSTVLNDKAMSAVVILDGGRYFGEEATYNLDSYEVLLPVVYGMPMAMPSIVK